jgi:glycosyltransferase involved in cell wall biosynthesis
MRHTISAVVAAYNSEAWIGETIESILSQTRPPDEVVVVDDGSTDGTTAELAGFGDSIRTIRRENGGCPAAFNTAFAAASGDYVALCGADDIWEPRKLEWQAETLAEHPEVDIACGHARVFGIEEGAQPRPAGTGLLDGTRLLEHLYRGNTLCAPSAVIRRSLFERLGPFVEEFRRGAVVERFNADDYEYWMRALKAGAQFFYDPRILVSYRRHEGNITNDYLHMRHSTHAVHRTHAGEIADPGLVRDTLASDLFAIARDSAAAGRPREARAAFLAALRYRPMPRAIAWALVLSLPPGAREAAVRRLVAIKRRLDPPESPATARWSE